MVEMKKLKLKSAVLALVCVIGALPVYAQDDGIPVEKLSRMRGLGGDSAQFDQQSKLQYDQMLKQAHDKDAVASDNNPQLIRLRAIAKRLKKLPPNARLGANENTFLGAFRLWDDAMPSPRPA
jgi:hypothetical protein